MSVEAKSTILRSAGYRYHFDRQVYYNPSTRKVFSLEFVEDNSPSEIQRRIDEITNGTHWRFYFNSVPSEPVKRQIEIALGR